MYPRADHTTPSSGALHPSEPTARILVVDPDEETRSLYRQSLALIGCDIVEAPDGRDALVQALMGPPTLVVTEVRLPFIDGCGLCDILRRDPATADVPILIITGEARPAELARARRMGADAVLVKPTTPEQMVAETRRLIGSATELRGRAVRIRAAAVAQRVQCARQRGRLSKSFARVATTAPPVPPPVLVCPLCDGPLRYEQSYVGGVSERHQEQWDRYGCPAACGSFEYRQRTRRLRSVA